MSPPKASPLKFPPSGVDASGPTPSKSGSPSTRITVNPSPNVTTTASALAPTQQPENISDPHELTAFVEIVLNQLENNFDELSTQVLDRMSQMSSRIDSLENSIQELLNGEIGSTPSTSAPDTPAVRTHSLRGAH